MMRRIKIATFILKKYCATAFLELNVGLSQNQNQDQNQSHNFEFAKLEDRNLLRVKKENARGVVGQW